MVSDPLNKARIEYRSSEFSDSSELRDVVYPDDSGAEEASMVQSSFMHSGESYKALLLIRSNKSNVVHSEEIRKESQIEIYPNQQVNPEELSTSLVDPNA